MENLEKVKDAESAEYQNARKRGYAAFWKSSECLIGNFVSAEFDNKWVGVCGVGGNDGENLAGRPGG